MQAYEPTWKEKIGAHVQDWFEGLGMKHLLAQGAGERSQEIASSVPGVSGTLSAQEGVREAKAGKYAAAAGSFANTALDFGSIGLGSLGKKGVEKAAEGVVAPAIKSGEQVIVGHDHPAIEAATGLKAPQEGFVTPKGEFVGREEAAKKAQATGQAAPETTGRGLHSEDLPEANRPPTQEVPKLNLKQVNPEEHGYLKPRAGVDDRVYGIYDGDHIVGYANIRVDGAKADVRDIYSLQGGRDKARGIFGTKNTSQLLRQFIKENPGVKTLTGDRVSGARKGGKWSLLSDGTSEHVEIPVSGAHRKDPYSEALAKIQGETVLGKPAPKGLSAQANIIPDAPAGDAKGLIRQRLGLGARDSAEAVTKMAPYERHFNAMPEEDVGNFWRYAESRSTEEGAKLRPKDPTTAAMADELREQMQVRRRKLENLDDEGKMGFIQDYVSHIYNETPKPGVTAGTGASHFLRERKIPTYDEALNAGLTPKYTPLETATRYTSMMDKHIALKEVREIGKEGGSVKHALPGKQPEGWVELKNTRNQMGQAQYAPADWAQAYNRTVDFMPQGGAWGAVKSVANASQALSFALNGRHALTIGVEALGSELSRGLSHAVAGDARTAAASFLKAPVAVGSYYKKGKRGLDIYSGLNTAASKEENEIVSLLSQANAHSGHMPRYLSATKEGSYYGSWKAGSLPKEFERYRQQIAEKSSALGKFAKTTQVGGKLLGRAMDTMMGPLFGELIPKVKYGVQMEMMGDWLAMNPIATHAEKLSMARKIADHVDNVYGELMMDNRFLDRKVREGLETGLISVGWNYGFYSELKHGLKAAGRSLGRAASIGSPHYDPRMAGLIGMVAGTAVANSAYQYLKTGHMPEEPKDLMTPKTGGLDVYGQPERGPTITNMKEVMDLKAVADAAMRSPGAGAKAGTEYVKSKIKPIFNMAADLATNSDWRGDPIFKPSSMAEGEGAEQDWNAAKEWTKNFFDFVWKGNAPFVANDRRGPDSNISKGEALMGLQPAGRRTSDPEGSAKAMDAMERRRWLEKEAHDKKERERYGGTSQ